MGLHPAVAAVRRAVRADLADAGERPVLVACSGGPDSLALLAATVFEVRRLPCRVIGVSVDHGLQDGSAERTAQVVEQMAALGADETASVRVRVDRGGRGPEAAAREARYAVLDEMAEHFGSTVVLLGHTLDDQAETVLLGLTRGSGGRSLAGMRRRFGRYRRPLLDVRRADTVTACQVEGIDYWDDPHNHDPGYTRVRVRRTVLPVLEEQLGPGVAATLARTADQLREDVEALDDLAEQLHERVRRGDGLALAGLDPQPAALRTRVLRRAAVEAGAIPAELTHGHVRALAELLARGPGAAAGKQVQLPGHVTAFRQGDLLRFRPTAVES